MSPAHVDAGREVHLSLTYGSLRLMRRVLAEAWTRPHKVCGWLNRDYDPPF